MMLWCWLYARRWSEPVDFALLLSQTKYNWCLAAVEADVDGARYDVVAQCVLAASPDWTSSVHIRVRLVGCRQDDDMSCSIFLCYYPKQKIIGD
jgi:hypothetical protein